MTEEEKIFWKECVVSQLSNILQVNQLPYQTAEESVQMLLNMARGVAVVADLCVDALRKRNAA